MKHFLLLNFLLVFYGTAAVCQSKNIHLSWNGKKEVNTSHTMAFTWTSDKPEDKMLRYGLNMNDLNGSAQGQVNSR